MPPDASTRAISRSGERGATSRAGSIHALNATGSAAMASNSDARATNVHAPRRAGRLAASGAIVARARDGVSRSASELEIDELGTLEDAQRHDGENCTRVSRPAKTTDVCHAARTAECRARPSESWIRARTRSVVSDAMRYAPCKAPHTTNVQRAPCQSPLTRNVMGRAAYRRGRATRLPPSGM